MNKAGSDIWHVPPRTRFTSKTLDSASSFVTGRQILNGLEELALLKTSCPKLLDIPSNVPHSRAINISVLRKLVTYSQIHIQQHTPTDEANIQAQTCLIHLNEEAESTDNGTVLKKVDKFSRAVNVPHDIKQHRQHSIYEFRNRLVRLKLAVIQERKRTLKVGL
jgi:hypothetical protein